MTRIAIAILFCIPPAFGQQLSLEAMLDDTGSPQAPVAAPAALRPSSTTIDQVYRTITIDWADQPDETLPFAAILQVEHARAWDGAPEELFVVFQDGRRILLSQGSVVTDQTELMRAWLAHSMVELPVGEGHSKASNSSAPPTLVLTAAGAGLSIGRLSGTIERAQASTVSEMTEKRRGSCVNCIDKRDLDRVVKMRMDKIRGC